MNSLEDLFINRHGRYAFQLRFEAVLVAICCVYLLLPVVKKFPAIVLLILLVGYMSNEYVKIRQTTMTDFNKDTFNKLMELEYHIDHINKSQLEMYNKSLGINTKVRTNTKTYLDSLYIDANVIHFLHSILPLYEYNNLEFYLLANGTNNILKIKEQVQNYFEANDVYPDNIAEMFEASLILRKKTINNIHNFIYSIPKQNRMYQYLDQVKDRYTVLITRTTDSIHVMYNQHKKNTGINSYQKLVSYDSTRAFDPHETPSLFFV